jgi:hypothetical protein
MLVRTTSAVSYATSTYSSATDRARLLSSAMARTETAPVELGLPVQW